MDLNKDIILNKIKEDLEKSGREFLSQKLSNEDGNILKDKCMEVLNRAQDSGIIDKDYKVYKTKLPRKLKKQHKKNRLIDITVSYRISL